MKRSRSKTTVLQGHQIRESEKALAKLSNTAATLRGRQGTKKDAGTRPVHSRTNSSTEKNMSAEHGAASFTYDSLDPKSFG